MEQITKNASEGDKVKDGGWEDPAQVYRCMGQEGRKIGEAEGEGSIASW